MFDKMFCGRYYLKPLCRLRLLEQTIDILDQVQHVLCMAGTLSFLVVFYPQVFDAPAHVVF